VSSSKHEDPDGVAVGVEDVIVAESVPAGAAENDRIHIINLS
jgi:hypothetical protein